MKSLHPHQTPPPPKSLGWWVASSAELWFISLLRDNFVDYDILYLLIILDVWLTYGFAWIIFWGRSYREIKSQALAIILPTQRIPILFSPTYPHFSPNKKQDHEEPEKDFSNGENGAA